MYIHIDRYLSGEQQIHKHVSPAGPVMVEAEEVRAPREMGRGCNLSLSLYIYIYVYIHIYNISYDIIL